VIANLLEKLARDPCIFVCLTITENTKISQQLLAQLARDRDKNVFKAVANKLHTPPFILDMLRK
jgi:hypothetical protein